MQELLGKNQLFTGTRSIKKRLTQSVKHALADATTLADEGGRFVLVKDASAVAIAEILQQEQEQEYNGKTILRPIVYGSKSLTRTQLNYGATKLEMYASRISTPTLQVENSRCAWTNEALSWLKIIQLIRP